MLSRLLPVLLLTSCYADLKVGDRVLYIFYAEELKLAMSCLGKVVREVSPSIGPCGPEFEVELEACPELGNYAQVRACFLDKVGQ